MIDFDTKVSLTVLNGFLAAAGPLLCDPVAHVSEVSFRVSSNNRMSKAAAASAISSREVNTTVSTRVVASTKQRIFTAHPQFDEVLNITIPHERATLSNPLATSAPSTATAILEKFLAITIIDQTTGQFLGEAFCPFSLSFPTTGSQKRLMLMPRNTRIPDDPLFKKDMMSLEALQLDDFGFITVDWRVTLLPHGGALVAEPAQPVPLPPFPIGLVVKAQWLISAEQSSSGRGFHYSTSIDLGGVEKFLVDGNSPLFLTVHSPAQLETCFVTCCVQKGQHGVSQSARMPLPIQPVIPGAMERDVMWCAPVMTDSSNWGVLMASIRLVPKPIPTSLPLCRVEKCSAVNLPTHQAQYSHETRDWGRPAPDCPAGAYQLLCWESDAHIARSTERRWKRDCLRAAKPTVEHVRHLYEVLLGRVQVDLSVSQLMSSFFNKPSTSVTPQELKQLLVAMAFNSDMTAVDAARFSFVILRRDAEKAVQTSDVAFLLEHSLLPRTVDMPAAEIERRAYDLFGGLPCITFDAFTRYFLKNYAVWYELGVAVEHNDCGRPSTSGGARSHPADAEQRESSGDAAQGANVWRTFTVRVIKTGRAFAVTAHVQDRVEDVAGMIEASTMITGSRQVWVMAGLAVDPRKTIGTLFPTKSTATTPEVSITEREETVQLVLVHREKGRRWEAKFPTGDKVLKLRAHVQQKTMIPLSRCVLRSAGQTMSDRHALDHYKLEDGAIIEVSQE